MEQGLQTQLRRIWLRLLLPKLSSSCLQKQQQGEGEMEQAPRQLTSQQLPDGMLSRH